MSRKCLTLKMEKNEMSQGCKTNKIKEISKIYYQ